LNPEEVAEFEALRSRKENQEVRAVAMTWSETQQALGREKGLEEGLEKGLEKGRKEGVEAGARQGARQVLLLLLGKRFGPLPETVRRRVEAISSLDRLAELAERVLSAHSLEEMGLA
jgi:flagellar biosynthesis/type III secretory pathway protein FliH